MDSAFAWGQARGSGVRGRTDAFKCRAFTARTAMNARQRSRNTAPGRRQRLPSGQLTTHIEHFGYDVGIALRKGTLPPDARPALEALIATLAEILGESASLGPPPASGARMEHTF